MINTKINTKVDTVIRCVQLGALLNPSPVTIANSVAMLFTESNSDSLAYDNVSIINQITDTDYKNYLVYKLLINL